MSFSGNTHFVLCAWITCSGLEALRNISPEMSPVVQKLSLGICRGGMDLCYQEVVERRGEVCGSVPSSTSS